MAERQLIDYIHTSQQSGMSSDVIKQGLSSAGWTQGQIDEAFQVVNTPKPPVPVPPSVVPKRATSKKKYSSPYSLMLAIVLVVSLLILAQNAVTDILDRFAPNTTSPSFRMILHAIIVLPFWIITFFLSISLKEDRKKYGSLLTAYYITSGWLLISLFFNVAGYIYNSNSTIGVYVVFGMLAVILTGGIWGVQKYRHNSEN